MEQQKINEFINQYRSRYRKEYQYRLDELLNHPEHSSNMISDQIFSYLDYLEYKKDLYRWFLEFIKNQYGLDKNILEVGGGPFPSLAYSITNEQERISKGSITVYDPDLVLNKLGNINLRKQIFTKDEDISKYDLIVGIKPCTATIPIIESANQNHKPFAIILCDCLHDYLDKCIDFWDEEVFDDYLYLQHQKYLQAARASLPTEMVCQKEEIPSSYRTKGALLYSYKQRK